MSSTRRQSGPSHSGPHTSTLRAGRGVRRAAAAAAVAALLVSACGSADDSVSSDAAVEETEAIEDAAPVEDAAAVDAEPAGLQQTGPIDVKGAPLDPYDMSIEDLSVGMSAPVVSGQSFDGTEIVIGGPTENPTLVVFLAHWCGHCNAEVPELVALEDEGLIPDGLDVVGVSTAVAADRDNYPPSEWVDDKGWPWPTMADDEVQTAIAAFGGTSFPFAVVLDTDGTVLARRAGQATGDDTVEFLDAALAGVAG